MTGKVVKWPNRGRDRPTQPREKVPCNPMGSGQALDVANCNDAVENQAHADLEGSANPESGGVQVVAAQPGADPDQIRRIIGPREYPVQRRNQ